jgi:hypothetical protein
MGADVRITCSIDRRRPVGNGPPMIDTRPAVAVMALLHGPCHRDGNLTDPRQLAWASAGSFRPATFSTTSRTAGSHPAISACQLLAIVPSHARVFVAPDRPRRRDHDVVAIDQPGRGVSLALHLNDRRRTWAGDEAPQSDWKVL